MSATNGQAAGLANLSEEQRKALAKCHYESSVIEETFGSAVLTSVSRSSLGSVAGPGGFKVYRDRILAASGQPRDPVEAMLLEQLAWAHHRLGSLHVSAAAALAPEQASILTTASTKLMAEFRKTALALKEYRSPPGPKQLTVVKQQNVAAGNQQVALVEAEAASQMPIKNSDDSEVGSKQILLKHDERTSFIPKAVSRQVEPAQAPRTDGRRPSAIERSGGSEPSVGILDRT